MRMVAINGLWTLGEEIAFTARPKIQSQSQIFRYGWSIFCLPRRPNFSDFFNLCLHWVSVVHGKIEQSRANFEYKGQLSMWNSGYREIDVEKSIHTFLACLHKSALPCISRQLNHDNVNQDWALKWKKTS